MQVTELEGDVLIEARDVVGLVAACVLVERVPRVRRKLVVLDATAEGGRGRGRAPPRWRAGA